MAAGHTNPIEAAMAKAMKTLPQEIIAQILSRLPVKALRRFGCVSKAWRSLISSPDFVNMHLEQRLTQKLFILFTFWLKIQSLDYEALVNGDDDENSVIKDLQLPLEKGSICIVKVLGSSNGLLCLGCQGLGDDDIILWNPSIGEHKKFQELPGLGSYGFGYDSCNDDYKLVKVLAKNVSGTISVDVFSLRTHSWRRVCHDGHSFYLLDDRGTFFNGSIYWQAKQGDTKTMTLILSFDLVKEKFRELPKPDGTFAEGPMLGVLGEYLCACRSELGKDFEVWAMKEEGDQVSWIKLATVSQGKGKEPEYILPYEYSIPLCFAKNGEALIFKGAMQLAAYDLKENSYRRIFIIPDDFHEFDGVLYMESLVSPNAYDGAH